MKFWTIGERDRGEIRRVLEMIKGKTALSVWYDFLEKNKREPEKDEFMDLGYSRSTYFKTKRDYKEAESQEVVRDGVK